jgi:hypothetical protein
MDELSPSGKTILDRARDARSPTDADAARVRRALGAAIAGAAATSVPSAAAASTKVASGIWIKGALFAVVGGGIAAVAVPIAWPGAEEPPPSIERALAAPEVVETPAIEARAITSEEPPRETARERRRPTPRGEGDLAAELELLHRAQAAWRDGDGAEVLDLVREHERRFARSQFGHERRALRILALCETGQVARARQLGQRFLATDRDSPLRRSVEESCAAR